MGIGHPDQFTETALHYHSMPAVSYERLIAFLEVWEASLQQPEGMLFVPSFDNLVRLALSQLSGNYASNPNNPVQRNSPGYKWQLLQEIERSLKRKDPIVQILRRECATDLSNLAVLLAQPRYDLSRIYPLLQSISTAPSRQLLEKELTRELISVRKLNRLHLIALTQLLLRKILMNLGVSELERLPRKILAQAYINFILPRFREALITNTNLNRLCNRAIQDTFLSAAAELNQMQKLQEQATDGAFWFLISEIPSHLGDTILQTLRLNPANNDPIAILLSEAGRVESIGQAILRTYLEQFLAVFFRAIGWGEEESRDNRLSEVGTSIGDALLTVTNLGDNRKRNTGIRPHVQDIIAAEAVMRAIASMLARRCLVNYRPDDWQALAVEVAWLVLTSIRDDATARRFSWLTASEDQISRFLYDCSARRSLQSAILVSLQPLMSYCITEISTVPSALASELSTEESAMLWREWAESFLDRVPEHWDVFDYLPWSELTVKQFRESMQSFFEEVFRSTNQYLVIMRVNNINPQGEIWSTGNMTFYDPSIFNYGEERYPSGPTMGSPISIAGTLANDSPTSVDANVTGIVVHIDANSEYAAQQEAVQNSKDALHVLSFAFSIGTPVGGFKPETAIGRATYQISGKHWTWQWHRERADTYQALQVQNQNVVRFAQAYDRIITRSMLAAPLPNDLQQAFLDSLHWYVRGRWERDPVERFLFHWIGLEHLFVGKKPKKEELFDSLPKLHTTWMSIQGVGHFVRSYNRLIAMMKESENLSQLADRANCLRSWRSDYRVLMNGHKLPSLRKIFDTADTLAQNQLNEFAAALHTLMRQRKKVKKAVEFERQRFEFKLRLLYEWRNEMAHQAASYRPGMEFYANEIESILENILRKIADEALRDPAVCTSVDAMIGLYKGPFI